MTEQGGVVPVPTQLTSGRRRRVAVAFVASFGTLWLVLPPASAGPISGEMPASVRVVDVTVVPATPQDDVATSADPDVGIAVRNGEGNPEEGPPPDRPRAVVLGVFLAANAVVVLTAGVLRYRSSSTRGHRSTRRQPRSTRPTQEAELA